MPILSQEPMVFPASLLDEPASATLTVPETAGASCWFVAHTKPRQEKALARYLYARTIPYFLPQHTRCLSNRRGDPASFIPLFPGYVFIHSDEAGRLDALQSNRIVAPLRVLDQIRLADDLRRVKRLIDSQLPLYPEDRLAPGQRVRIVSGPLTGLLGTVENRLARCRFVVAVDFIRQGVSVEVDARALEPDEAPEGQFELSAHDAMDARRDGRVPA